MQAISKPLIVLVGLMGSGKSEFVKHFATKGAGVILTDDLWKQEIYKEENRSRLMKVFGEDVLWKDGRHRKNRIRNLLFSTNQTEHEACHLRYVSLFAEFENYFLGILNEQIEKYLLDEQVTMVIVESAYALVNDWYKRLSPAPGAVVSFHCNKLKRLQRVLRRDPSIYEATYLAIMSMQPTDEEHALLSDRAHAIQVNGELPIQELEQIGNRLHLLFTSTNRKW